MVAEHPDKECRARSRARATHARAEVVDVLAEALWDLICTGRGPTLAGIVPGAGERALGSQPVENMDE